MAEEIKGAADRQAVTNFHSNESGQMRSNGNPAANDHREGRRTLTTQGQAEDGRGGGGDAQTREKDESLHHQHLSTNHNVGQPRRKPSLPGHEGFVRPSSYLRRSRGLSGPMHPPKDQQETAVDREQRDGLVSPRFVHYPRSQLLDFDPHHPRQAFQKWRVLASASCINHADPKALQKKIRSFLKARTSYDVMPVSFRLIVFDTSLLVEKSLNILIQNGKFLRQFIGRWELKGARHHLRAVMGFKNVFVRRFPHHVGLHQPHPVLLAESRGRKPD